MTTDGPLFMWVIYKHPKDFPDQYVVRMWAVEATGHVPSGQRLLADTLEGARALLPPGLVNIGRYDNDDPVIEEVWI